MSEALIVRRGGSAKLFAAIGVTYPAGSTCTCTDGVKSFAAKDTSGQWLFPIPYAGTWTVTATDGTDTKSQEVVITGKGEAAVVTLEYWNGELYDRGNQFEAVTGGWTGFTHENDDNLEIRTNNETMVYMRPANQIDVTNYTTATLICNNASGNTGELVVGTAVKVTGNIGNAREYEIVLDITNISGPVDVKVGTRRVATTTAFKMFSLILS